MHLFSIILNSLFIVITIFVIHSKTAQDELFKINKLNLVWTKAQHSLGTNKLKDLKNDLAKHELDELNLKKMKAHGNDKDGLFEAAVRKRLLSIMTKYSLERYFDDIHTSYDGDGNKTNPNEAKIDHQKLPDSVPIFRDTKLDKLWKKAEKSGFTQEQLMILHEEFQHQQDKLDEHYETMNMINDELDKNIKNGDKLENSIENNPETRRSAKIDRKEASTNKKARLDENIHQHLKDKHSDIKKGYEKLHNKIATGAIDEATPFEEESVNKLWSNVLQYNFSGDELESLKEELRHYETRIKKLKHFQNQLERKLGSKESSSYAEEDEETKHIKKRVEELSLKVGKSHKTIEKRIQQNKRDEL